MPEDKKCGNYQFNALQLASLNQLFPNAASYPAKIILRRQVPQSIRDARARLPRRTTLELPAGGHPTPSAKRMDVIAFSSVVTERTTPRQLPSRSKQRRGGRPVLLAAALHTSMSLSSAFYLPRHDGNTRFWWTKDDIASFRRILLGELLSINPELSAEQNIQTFLTSLLDDKTEDIRQAVFHYLPKTDINDCFELGIASPEMFAAAWQSRQTHSNGRHIQNLPPESPLFVMVVMDENLKGVPVALFRFSAHLGNQQTSAGYDTMEQYLSKWKAALGQKEGEIVTPKVLKISERRTADRIHIGQSGINFMQYLFKHWLRIDILSMWSAESRALEREVLQLKRLCGPGPASSLAPEPAPERGVIVWIAHSVQDAAPQRLLDLHLSNLANMSRDPPSSLLVVSVPSATEASKVYARTVSPLTKVDCNCWR
ncbi:hypothetical protein BDK51DRAFT_51538 [Blyttiomyces helicus]|uniref:Uncharacterized protein n=1 Tax=Blyttiomyces helicus TaxID=388810 RepID=A0A4P9WLZ0_9FUNG|nr:hypothetical protein BDK51DRAFT_51538 [Blyttiomyces helicus]|eukprot:RKO93452.1 hypothetical protein BDK51DRAFT_51538 [Blyttiomyces helicus]